MKPTRAQRTEAYEALRQAFADRTAQINARYLSGTIDEATWLSAMREEVKQINVQAYAAGRGGKWSDITFSEWGRLGQKMPFQYRKLTELAGQLPGNFSAAQLNARLNLYANAARQQFESAIAAEKGVTDDILPALPGDGTTQCMINCKCRWAIRKRHNVHICTWRLGRAEHCRTCLQRAVQWKNLRIVNGRMVSEVEPIFVNR